VFGLVLAVAVVVYRLRWPEDFSKETAGWASLMVALLVVSGIQLIFFGVLGEYTGRTFLNVNRKPQSAIREVLNSTTSDESIEAGHPALSTRR
jgi:undecaprenyl-phosphate 4-deoxy-4-formamido-L-arabinose transferase